MIQAALIQARDAQAARAALGEAVATLRAEVARLEQDALDADSIGVQEQAQALAANLLAAHDTVMNFSGSLSEHVRALAAMQELAAALRAQLPAPVAYRDRVSGLRLFQGPIFQEPASLPNIGGLQAEAQGLLRRQLSVLLMKERAGVLNDTEAARLASDRRRPE